MPPGGMAALAPDAPPQTVLAVRRDAVALDRIDPAAQLVHDGAALKIYLSPETVPFAAPGALVRCELIVAWTALPDGTARLRASLGEDRDEIALRPYQQTPIGLERFALLVGMPARAGRHPIQLALGDTPLATIAIEVADDPQRAVEVILDDANIERVARRLGWLREQRIPRLGMAAFRSLAAALARDDRARSPAVGAHIMKLRWNARLASHEALPSAIRRAEQQVIAKLFAACPQRDARVLCLGRTIDRLRRFGYLGLDAPELADAPPGDGSARYPRLVGLTLAMPGDVALQRQLLAERLAVAKRGSFSPL
jgi:hypothetical protein